MNSWPDNRRSLEKSHRQIEFFKTCTHVPSGKVIHRKLGDGRERSGKWSRVFGQNLKSRSKQFSVSGYRRGNPLISWPFFDKNSGEVFGYAVSIVFGRPRNKIGIKKLPN